jgi:hypothetical protein
MSEQTTLGALLDDTACRDAIHIALAPVVAGHILQPGEHVGWMDNSRSTVGRVPTTFGIVDPFLRAPVMPGQRFYLCLYQQTITGLRHVWTHPEFADVPASAPAPKPGKEASEAWLRHFIANADCPGYERVIAAALEDDRDSGDHKWDDYLHFDGSDAQGEIPPEFWDHVEVVTGQKITNRPGRFSCGC